MIDLCIFGSPRKNQNTMKLVKSVCTDFEQVLLSDYEILGCKGCQLCHTKHACVIKDDFNQIMKRVREADRLVIASPVYFNSISWILKNFVDRLQIEYVNKIVLKKEIKKKNIVFLMTSGSILSDDIKKSIQVQMDLVIKVLGGNSLKFYFMENLDRESFEEQIVDWKQKNSEIFKLFSIS